MSAITIRPVRAEDRPDLEEIAARTWNGTDYLPTLIDSWIADPHGGFWAAQQGYKVIGTVKLTRLTAGEWWMEGMRVHPDFHGRGVGRLLHDYLVAEAQKVGSGALRFCTNLDNIAIQKMALATGFTQRARFLRYTVRPAAQPPEQTFFRALTPADIPAVRALLERSRFYNQADRSLIQLRWLCRFITDSHLLELIESGQAFSWYGVHSDPWRVDGLLLGYAAPSVADPSMAAFYVTYLDALPSHLATMAHEVKGWSAQLKVSEVRYMMAVSPDRLVAIEQAGWRRPGDNSGRACLFSRPLGNG